MGGRAAGGQQTVPLVLLKRDVGDRSELMGGDEHGDVFEVLFRGLGVVRIGFLHECGAENIGWFLESSMGWFGVCEAPVAALEGV